MLCCDLACSAAASAWKLWPVRYSEDMVQSGGILIRSRHWSHIQHSINFTRMNMMQVNTSCLLIWVLILHSFTVLHQYVATSECLLWVVTIPDCLGWWMIEWLLLCFIDICVFVEMYFLPHYHYVIHCWFPFYSAWSFSYLRMRCSGWYSLVLVFGALQMCVVLCHGVECNTADLTCVTPLQA